MEFNQLHFFLDSSPLFEWNDNEMKTKRAAEKKKWRADEWNGGLLLFFLVVGYRRHSRYLPHKQLHSSEINQFHFHFGLLAINQ